jgi:hypothetical protein
MAPEPHLSLSFRYDLEQRECAIQFDHVSQAVAYQWLNKEARIFNYDMHVVWIPKPHGMKYILDSNTGDKRMAMIFDKEESAKIWQKKIAFGIVCHHGKEYGVYIQHRWSYSQLKQIFGTKVADSFFQDGKVAVQIPVV